MDDNFSVTDLPWCTYVTNLKTKRVTTVILKPNAQEIDVEGLDVLVHYNGIEFLGRLESPDDVKQIN